MSNQWRRYWLDEDGVRCENVSPFEVYYENVSDDPRVWVPSDRAREDLQRYWNESNDRRFVALDNLGCAMMPTLRTDYLKQLREMITPPPPPYVRFRDPYTTLSPVAAAVKIALDGSVN